MRATTHVLKGNGSALRWLQRWLARGSTGRGITVGGRPAMPRLPELTANYAAATGPRTGANAIRDLKFHPATQPYRPPLEAWLRPGRPAGGGPPSGHSPPVLCAPMAHRHTKVALYLRRIR